MGTIVTIYIEVYYHVYLHLGYEINMLTVKYV